MRCAKKAILWEESLLSFNKKTKELHTGLKNSKEDSSLLKKALLTWQINISTFDNMTILIESEEAILLARRMTETNEELNYVVHGAHESREGSGQFHARAEGLMAKNSEIEHIADQMHQEVQNLQFENQQIVAASQGREQNNLEKGERLWNTTFNCYQWSRPKGLDRVDQTTIGEPWVLVNGHWEQAEDRVHPLQQADRFEQWVERACFVSLFSGFVF